MADEDAIVIDLEISTGSIKELQDVLKQIREAEKSVQQLKTENVISGLKSKRSKIPGVGGGPADISRITPELTGALGGQAEGEALPIKGRDRTSKQAVQVESRFKELESDVKAIDKFLNIGGSALGFAGAIGSKGIIGFIEKIFKHPLGKAFLVLTLGKAVIEGVVDLLQAPGSPFDIRFLRKIKQEIAATFTRRERAELRQGFRSIIITTRPGLRGGQGQIRSNLSDLSDRNPQYDYTVDVYAKGLNLP